MKLKNKKYISILLTIFIVVLIGAYFLLHPKQSDIKQTDNSTSSKKTNAVKDYKASFAIYTNNTFRIFTDPMYHNLSPDVFIESSDPNIINVKKVNITWRDFFLTLPFSIDENCLITGTKQTFCSNNDFSLQFFINGVAMDSALDQIINPGDKLLVTYERENSERINKQIRSIPDSP